MGKLYYILCIMIAAALAYPAMGASQYMPILAVTEGGNESSGSLAHMSLTVRAGSGRVFIDSFPLTKVDTQMSTRFATKIGCAYAEVDCDNLDFFYVIRADSSLVGGPSASSAAAVLTASILGRDKLLPNMTITGTINSGDVIGMVGGVKEKIEAASKSGIHTVLIPRGDGVLIDGNDTLDLIALGNASGVRVVEVGTLSEAMEVLTGKSQGRGSKELVVPESYTEVMRSLAEMLCLRTERLNKERGLYSYFQDKDSEKGNAENLSIKGKEAFESGRYYSGASYCFGANVQLRAEINRILNQTPEFELDKARYIKRDIRIFEEELDSRKLVTINDLQAYMIVKERVLEATIAADEAIQDIEMNRSAGYNLAYSEERLYSARAWAHFFDDKGAVYDFGTESLRDSCIQKISEADESYRYLEFYFPVFLLGSRDDYMRALEDYRNGEYALCLYRASKAKASSNMLINALGRDESQIDDLIGLKLDIAEDFIAGQITESQFPIVGYSYLEYAESLRESDPYSSMLFIEYSLEIGNIDLYFTKEKKDRSHLFIDIYIWKAFILGFVMGAFILFCLLYLGILIKKRSMKTQQNTRDECSAGKKR